MVRLAALPFFAVCVSIVLSFENLTQSDVEAIKSELRDLLNNYTANIAGNTEYKPLIPNTVRLSFHDCVGGCDGCINLNNADNNGTGLSVDALEELYENNEYSNVLSRADFWVLAGITSLELAHSQCGRRNPCINVPFKYGRQDCETSPSTDESRDFPNSHGNLTHVTEFMSNAFGLNQNETVALLGVHTLGMLQCNNSGFNGRWAGNALRLDNSFYRNLVEGNWTQENAAERCVRCRPRRNRQCDPVDPKHQWVSRNPGRVVMLNTDMCLFREINPDDEGANPECNFNSCARASTASLVEQFAEDSNLWIAEFTVAYEKMINTITTGELQVPIE